MKKFRQRQLEVSGQQDNINYIRTINMIMLSMVLAYNIIQFVKNSASLNIILINSLPLVICIALVLIFRSLISILVTYLLIGFLTVSFSDYPAEYSGIIYFVLACGLYKKNSFILSSFILSFLALTFRLIRVNASLPVSIEMIILFVFIFLSSYIVFFKEQHKRVDISKVISERDKAILKMYANGYSYELIITTLKLNIETATVRKIIKRIRDESPCRNDVQFGKWLYENG